MPATIHELNINGTIRVHGLKNRRASMATHVSEKVTMRPAASNPRDSGDETLLSLLQSKFDVSRRVRLDGGMTEKLKTSSHRGKRRQSHVEADRDGDVLSSEAAHNPNISSSSRHNRKASIGYDSVAHSDSAGKTTPRKTALGTDAKLLSSAGRTPRRSSVGYENEIQAGHFYTSGTTRRDSQAEGRTVKTPRTKESRHTRQTIGGSISQESVVPVSDGRMRISFSLQVKCIDLMVVQEDYFFEMSPEMQAGNTGGRLSPDELSRDYYPGEDSSSDEVSDLSVLTDDERYFSEEVPIGVIVEEEEEEGARLSSTDFLLFGPPENCLLRLTISSLGTFVRGKGAGPMQVTLSIGRISAVGDHESRVLSIGGLIQPMTPVAEVSVGTPNVQRRRSNDSMDVDLSSHAGSYHLRRDDFSAPVRSRPNAPGRAISLILCIEEGSKTIQCDFSTICLTVDLTPAAKLLQFVSKSEIIYPKPILAKSSRDVARKFMVYKTSNSSNLGGISTAIRVHGLEVTVPFTLNDTSASEASELDSSGSSEGHIGNETQKNNCTAVLVADTLELYSGNAIDEIVAGTAIDLGQSRSSLWSGSVASKKSTVKTIEMLDIEGLTSSHDSFACTHWVRIT
jgi:hypothetical protein